MDRSHAQNYVICTVEFKGIDKNPPVLTTKPYRFLDGMKVYLYWGAEDKESGIDLDNCTVSWNGHPNQKPSYDPSKKQYYIDITDLTAAGTVDYTIVMQDYAGNSITAIVPNIDPNPYHDTEVDDLGLEVIFPTIMDGTEDTGHIDWSITTQSKTDLDHDGSPMLYTRGHIRYRSKLAFVRDDVWNKLKAVAKDGSGNNLTDAWKWDGRDDLTYIFENYKDYNTKDHAAGVDERSDANGTHSLMLKYMGLDDQYQYVYGEIEGNDYIDRVGPIFTTLKETNGTVEIIAYDSQSGVGKIRAWGVESGEYPVIYDSELGEHTVHAHVDAVCNEVIFFRAYDTLGNTAGGVATYDDPDDRTPEDPGMHRYPGDDKDAHDAAVAAAGAGAEIIMDEDRRTDPKNEVQIIGTPFPVDDPETGYSAVISASLTQDPTTWTNFQVRVTTNLFNTDIAPYLADFPFSWSVDGGATWSVPSRSYDITTTENGPVMLRVYGRGDNVAHGYIDIKNIDHIKPNLSGMGDDDGLLYDPMAGAVRIIAGDNESGIAKITVRSEYRLGATFDLTLFETTIPELTKHSLDFRVYRPGTYTFEVTDIAGNVSDPKIVTISEADVYNWDDPTLYQQIRSYPPGWTNGPVKVAIELCDEAKKVIDPDAYPPYSFEQGNPGTFTNINWLEVTENQLLNIVVMDGWGGRHPTSYYVGNIDVVGPQVEVNTNLTQLVIDTHDDLSGINRICVLDYYTGEEIVLQEYENTTDITRTMTGSAMYYVPENGVYTVRGHPGQVPPLPG